jgi:hypothetical protein
MLLHLTTFNSQFFVLYKSFTEIYFTLPFNLNAQATIHNGRKECLHAAGNSTTCSGATSTTAAATTTAATTTTNVLWCGCSFIMGSRHVGLFPTRRALYFIPTYHSKVIHPNDLNLGLKAYCLPCIVYGKTQHRLQNPSLAGYQTLNNDVRTHNFTSLKSSS